jgi:putative acetyltransferase
MSVTISQERPDSVDAVTLIGELEAILSAGYPAESRHGYSVEKLIAQGVAFFVLRSSGVPAGCAGIQLFGNEYGEVKRMYVRDTFRGQGFAELLLNQLAEHARAHGVLRLRLETGIHQQAAVRFYERYGFYRITAFPPYINDPLSLYYEMVLQP